ncbi:urease accessory protein UreD [Ancylobacter defluvii]|uniref:Urease accessory protein UreD n=1 Tax=Ancylobacter defluvii TaxID=1282440 RepID=A0A9W6NBE0_9HYPH|nr:urease accessory protein UreD [Ancylobacter defluvii]MBS7588919.1 urease accessory protein UreD [Ancylobacter defluvii]GLK84520.1 urease accessory protein UreD [Ancylobacter defluvii]
MYVTALPCEAAAGETIPGELRSRGRLLLHARFADGRTIPDRIEEQGPSRIRFPAAARRGRSLEGIILNTGGGVAGGDHFAASMRAGEGARLVLTSQAAEKCYRSDGGLSRLSVDLAVQAGASLDWLPQATILFDGARVARTIHAEVAEGARLLLMESVVLGRTAHGERFTYGRLTDSWRIRRGGRLVYADGLSLGDAAGGVLARAACAHGWAAFATVLLVAPDAMARLDALREVADAVHAARTDVEIGVSAWDGMASVRLLARDGLGLDATIRRLIAPLGVCDPPRIWHF